MNEYRIVSCCDEAEAAGREPKIRLPHSANRSHMIDYISIELTLSPLWRMPNTIMLSFSLDFRVSTVSSFFAREIAPTT